jgi:hypothetical protein
VSKIYARGRNKLIDADAEPADGAETWSRQQLEAMNAEFCAAMQRAIRLGPQRLPDSERSRAA